MVRSASFITIQDLTPNKTYYIRVLAFTSVGDGPLSQDLQIIAKTGGKIQETMKSSVRNILNEQSNLFLTDPSLVPSQPLDFKGEAKSETSILLSWVAPSTQGGPESQITGYELVYRRVDDTEEVRMTDVICSRIDLSFHNT